MPCFACCVRHIYIAFTPGLFVGVVEGEHATKRHACDAQHMIADT